MTELTPKDLREMARADLEQRKRDEKAKLDEFREMRPRPVSRCPEHPPAEGALASFTHLQCALSVGHDGGHMFMEPDAPLVADRDGVAHLPGCGIEARGYLPDPKWDGTPMRQTPRCRRIFDEESGLCCCLPLGHEGRCASKGVVERQRDPRG
jgi:hypothetical protein